MKKILQNLVQPRRVVLKFELPETQYL